MIGKWQLKGKRVFDLCLSLVLLPVLLLPIVILIILSSIDTRQFGLFLQPRIGQFGKQFLIFKIRTIRSSARTSNLSKDEPTSLGQFLRHMKWNELPQVFNVLIGDMSFVGPRPDLKGFADRLTGEDLIILLVKPGITGPATLKYRHEEQLLSEQIDPETYNRTIIWPDKVEINKKYVKNWSFSLDLNILWKTLFS